MHSRANSRFANEFRWCLSIQYPTEEFGHSGVVTRCYSNGGFSPSRKPWYQRSEITPVYWVCSVQTTKLVRALTRSFCLLR